LHFIDGSVVRAHQHAAGAKGEPSGRSTRLEPTEARAMGLPVEPVDRVNNAKVSVARYVPEEWQAWLQHSRVELNAMTTPEFITWLNQKLAPHEHGKLIPPGDVLSERLDRETRDHLREVLTARILSDAGLEQQVEARYQALAPVLAGARDDLLVQVQHELDAQPREHWTDPVLRLARRVVDERT